MVLQLPRFAHLAGQHLVSRQRLSSALSLQLVPPLPHAAAAHKALHLSVRTHTNTNLATQALIPLCN